MDKIMDFLKIPYELQDRDLGKMDKKWIKEWIFWENTNELQNECFVKWIKEWIKEWIK